ncbi:SAF domain-containing protein [Streptomonospora nanhaiensis]|uniref:SAF domain-containing protein n=1 Tax=Streptomonospora nanhaiensis TaxID=1323731 RepID=UPI001C382E33|nr:SAF domain-containing protein [Streptomonospora nanhaiensis]MBV2361988.1 Flp pilus assembly protein CpaB [Streptomonospora nanhaiensis]
MNAGLRAFRLLARWRRALGAACAALALTGAVLLLRPTPAPTAEVWVAARPLTALEPIAPGDLILRALPAGAVPDGALEPSHPTVGRSLSGPVGRGEVITRARLADPPARGHGPGMVAAPLRVPDPGVVDLLHPGSRVDVLAAPADPAVATAADFGGTGGPAAAPAVTVVEDRPVIAVPDPGSGGGLGGGSPGGLVLLAVRPDEARALAGHAAGLLSITIRG